jgi:anti-sigma-K factor RskA
MEHSEYQELLALHAIDALDSREAQPMAAHLETCAECRKELAEMRDAAALLAHAAPPAKPSEDVRRKIMREIQRPAESSAAPAHKVVPIQTTPSSAWLNLLRLAAVVAFAALLLGLIVLWRRDDTSRREINELARLLNRQQRELQIERDNLAQQRELLAMLNSPDAKKMALTGTATAQTARATFLYDEKSGHAMLLIDGLPATPADKAYEIWFIPKGHAPMPGRTFSVGGDGRALVSDKLPLEAGATAVVAITLEPKSGSTAPTMPIYLASPAS